MFSPTAFCHPLVGKTQALPMGLPWLWRRCTPRLSNKSVSSLELLIWRCLHVLDEQDSMPSYVPSKSSHTMVLDLGWISGLV